LLNRPTVQLNCHVFQLNDAPAEAVSKKILSDVSRGLLFLHRLGFVHQDIKPENVLLRRSDGDRFDAVICDLGLVSTPGLKTSIEGTLPFLSRSAHRRQVSASSDFESLFFVAVITWAGRLPWYNLPSLQRVLQAKTEAFTDLEVFFAGLDAGQVPDYIRSFGGELNTADPDLEAINRTLLQHGITAPIRFDDIVQVKNQKLL
jgi:serine/threonine protein kinase